MDLKKFALIKYDHGDPVSLSGARLIWFVVILILTVGSMFVFFPASLFLGVAAVRIARQPKQLYLGPRYLICGKKILYYANIQRVSLEPAQGLLHLKSSTGQLLVLDQDKFHTNARKPDKIEANKAARFNKVARKIVGHVHRTSPNAELTDVQHLLASGA